MILSSVNKNDLDTNTKKTKPTQENEANSNSGNDKQGKEQENQLFNYKATENNIKEYSNNHKRQDKYGNPITKKGNQKVTFIDRITNKKFEEVIKIESFKDYNKSEEMKSKNSSNTCCLLV